MHYETKLVIPFGFTLWLLSSSKLLLFQNRRMKAKKDGKMQNIMEGMPDSGGVVSGLGLPDSSGRPLCILHSTLI